MKTKLLFVAIMLLGIIQDINAQSEIEFLNNMYKDFYEPFNSHRAEEAYISKYFTKDAMEKFRVESDSSEGEINYGTDFLIHGFIGKNARSYWTKVVSRTIIPENDNWFLVTNIWEDNVIKKVHLQVKEIEGMYKIVDINVSDTD